MQTVTTRFNQLAKGSIRPISYDFTASFDKEYNDTIEPWTWDSSQWDGGDVWMPAADNPIQAWDYYKYLNYQSRLMYSTVTRELKFPYSVVSSIADFQLNNYDKYFTPNSGSPISNYILPKRPIRLFMGFGSENLQVFVGLTEGMPEISRQDGLATFTAMDFLTWIYDMPIRNTIAMANVRTDQVLANIFEQFGLSPTQYDLGKGRNVIPFLFFEREQTTAGDVIRPIMEAEGGWLWLDEQGIIKFRPRLEQPISPVYTLTSNEIVTLDTSNDDEIINHVIINTNVREVQDYQQVFYRDRGNTNLRIVPAGGTYIFQAELSDPCLIIQQPTAGENSSESWFTAALVDGTPVISGVTITSSELKTNTYNMVFSNSNSFDVNIDQTFLWGRPARLISAEPEVYDAYDDVSVSKYEEKILTIDNNFIQSSSQAESLALTIVDEYSGLNDILDLEVKGNPAFQLADIIELDYEEFSGEYRIIKITNKIQPSTFTQQLKIRKYTPRTWWQWDVSQWDGTDVWAP